MKILDLPQAVLKSGLKKILYQLLPALLIFPVSLPASAMPPDWTLDSVVNGVAFYHAIVVCEGKKVVLLKMKNKNGYKVNVSWKELFITRQVREKKEGFNGKKDTVLSAGEIVASDCQENRNKKLYIPPIEVSPAYAADVEGFEYSNINVTKAL